MVGQRPPVKTGVAIWGTKSKGDRKAAHYSARDSEGHHRGGEDFESEAPYREPEVVKKSKKPTTEDGGKKGEGESTSEKRTKRNVIVRSFDGTGRGLVSLHHPDYRRGRERFRGRKSRTTGGTT